MVSNCDDTSCKSRVGVGVGVGNGHKCCGKKQNSFSRFKTKKSEKCMKWVRVPDTSLYEEYRPTVTCSKCKNFKTMHFMHDDDYGEYYCPNSKCEIMGSIRYLCLHCGRRKDSALKLVDEDSD